MKKKKYITKKPKNLVAKFFKKLTSAINFIRLIGHQLVKSIFQIGEENRRVFEILQLTIIYFLGIFQLLLTYLQMSDSVPEFYKSLPFFHELVYSPFGRFVGNPEKTLLFYLLVHEFIVIRPNILRFSLIVRYSLVYIMTLEFISYFILTWWDILCNFETDLIFEVPVDKAFITEFCLILFIIYFIIYLYSYIRAINRKLPIFPNPILQKVPDSVAFILRIKQEKKKNKN